MQHVGIKTELKAQLTELSELRKYNGFLSLV